MSNNDIQTLKEAARILARAGNPAAAHACSKTAAELAVDKVFGDQPKPAPGNRLERLAPQQPASAGHQPAQGCTVYDKNWNRLGQLSDMLRPRQDRA